MNNKYILVGRNPVICNDLTEWCKWFQDSKNRVVAQEKVGSAMISTVFLGLDHNFYGETGDPVLFETMVFLNGSRGEDELCERCHTYEQAIEQHYRVKKQVSSMRFRSSAFVKRIKKALRSKSSQ